MLSFKRLALAAPLLILANALYAQAPQQYNPQYAPQANNVWGNAPSYGQNSFNRSPWSNAMPTPWSGGSNGFNRMPWGSGSNSMPWNNGGNGFNSMPWSNGGQGNGFNMPWNNNSAQRGFSNGPGNGFPTTNFNGPWNNGSNSFPNIKGPWNNGWGAAPWSSQRWQNDPMGSPSKWINFNDPKEGVAEMWEDAIKGPHRLGKMPGGWKAPSISVPNPVDVTDTFGKRWRGLPSEISEQADNFTYNVAK